MDLKNSVIVIGVRSQICKGGRTKIPPLLKQKFPRLKQGGVTLNLRRTLEYGMRRDARRHQLSARYNIEQMQNGGQFSSSKSSFYFRYI